jgi:hypothetical protein
MKIKLHSAIFVLLLIFAPLSHAVLDLPSNLINFTSPQGQELLEHSLKKSWKNPGESNTLKLISHFATQKTTTYCGVASLAMVMNSSNLQKIDDPLHKPFHYFTQDNFFNEEVEAIVPEKSKDGIKGVENIGITLDQLTLMAKSFGLYAKAHHANEIGSLKEFRKVLEKAFSHQQFVIVNFTRVGLGQEGGGHHSPIAAYDVKNDRVLMLDVARYKYPAYWVTTEDLWKGVNTTDSDAKATRGILVIDRDPQTPPAPRTQE